MKTLIFEKRTELPCSADALFAYHTRPGALARLTPPFERVRNIVEAPAIEEGAVASLDVAIGPVWKHTVSRHHEVRPGRGFVDVMERGPFSQWQHTHAFEPLPERSSSGDGSEERCVLVDHIEYIPPAGPAGDLVAGPRLERVFAYRHAKIAADIALFNALSALSTSPRAPLRVGITGASGLIGRELAALLSVAGHRPLPFTRDARGPVRWTPATGALEGDALDGEGGLDCVVHLAGEPIAEGRLDSAHKARVRESRVDVTRALVASLAKLARPPRVFVSASAVGYYGKRGDELLDESAPRGNGFLAEVCEAWESAAFTARDHGMRAAALRMGIVLSPAGGALAKLLAPFRAGAGAQLGDGAHWMPLVSVDDVAGLALRALVDERVTGAVNATGPEPLTNAAFTATLARVLTRPAALRIPRAVAAAMFGRELVDEALMISQRAVPQRFTELGHAFRHASTESALRHVLGKLGKKRAQSP